MPLPASGHTVNFRKLTLWVLRLVWPYKRWGAIIILAMILETVMSLAAPWPLKIIIDNVIGDRPLPSWLGFLDHWITSGDKTALAAWSAMAMILFTAVGGIAGYVNSYFTESVSQYMANDLRQKIYHHLQRLSFAYYDSHQVGKLISTITTDVATIQDFAATTLLSILIDVFTIIGMLVLMFSLNWDFALIIVSVVPFLLLFAIRFRRTVKRATHEVRKDQSEMLTIIQQGLESIRAVNAFGRQDFEEEKLKKISTQTVEDALRARRMKSVISPVMTLTIAICTAFVLWRGAGLILAGTMTIGALTVFLSYLGKFFNPVKDLAKMTGNIAQALVSVERVNQILDASDIVAEKPMAVNPGNVSGLIEFDHVNFSYKPGIPVLKNISFRILPGQRVGICGPTGGGKSTLASLIPRFYDPDSGSIRIDGKDISDLSLEGLRRQIGFVLQDTMLFYGTIRENIAYGKPGATDLDIRDAAIKAQADEFIERLPQGYDTILGERGMTLSSGQRQRIGIARAIIRNSPILILDEPTASLDAESESIVTNVLNVLMEGRTVITITHHLHNIIDADNILVVCEGRLAEAGTHAELMEAGGLYADMFKLQQSEEPYRQIL